MDNSREWFTKNNNELRQRLIKIHGEQCFNCEATEGLTVHHIVPLVMGGTNKVSNIALLCCECHGKVHGTNMTNHRKLQREGI